MNQQSQSGLLLGRVPYARFGTEANPLIVLNGGQAFVRRPTPERTLRDARRIARLLPQGQSFVLLGYDFSREEAGSLDAVVADLSRILETEFGKARLLGISYGGVVGLRLAAARPDLVSQLILLSSAHDFSAEGRARVERQIACAQACDFAALVGDFAAVFKRPWLNWLLRMRLRSRRHKLAVEMNDPAIITRGLRAVLGSAQPDTRWLGAVSARTLVIGGTADQFFGAGRMDETAAAIKGAELRLFAGETHMVAVERSRDVAAAISDFLSGA